MAANIDDHGMFLFIGAAITLGRVHSVTDQHVMTGAIMTLNA